MRIIRINQFEAKPEAADELYRFFESVIPGILASPGCIACQLLRSLENPACLAIIEEWESVELHQQAAKVIPPHLMAQAVALFAKAPQGMYYQ